MANWGMTGLGWWPFDEVTTEHIGLAIVFVLTSLGLYLRHLAEDHTTSAMVRCLSGEPTQSRGEIPHKD